MRVAVSLLVAAAFLLWARGFEVGGIRVGRGGGAHLEQPKHLEASETSLQQHKLKTKNRPNEILSVV